MVTVEELEKLRASLKNPELNDDDAFRRVLIMAQGTLILSDQRCAELFDVSRPSVNRWKNGTTAPRRVVRRHVYAQLLKQVERALGMKKRDLEKQARAATEHDRKAAPARAFA